MEKLLLIFGQIISLGGVKTEHMIVKLLEFTKVVK